MRVGVIADTHFQEFLDDLPDSVYERLAGCELILHAGDIGRPEALERLRRFGADLQRLRSGR